MKNRNLILINSIVLTALFLLSLVFLSLIQVTDKDSIFIWFIGYFMTCLIAIVVSGYGELSVQKVLVFNTICFLILSLSTVLFLTGDKVSAAIFCIPTILISNLLGVVDTVIQYLKHPSLFAKEEIPETNVTIKQKIKPRVS